MNEIFGIRMTAIMQTLVVLLALCLLAVAWVAWRRPVVFKLGVRNIPRRKAQTLLIVVGLMLSTLIISAALGTGDTIDHSATAETYRSLGHVDELVVASQDVEGDVDSAYAAKFDAAKLGLIEQTFAGDARVDGILPVLLETVPVLNEAKGQGEPVSYLAGVDAARLDQFGGLRAVGGETVDLAATAEDEVVVSETTADKLAAEVGDTLTVFYGNRPVPLRVVAVAEDTPLSGQIDLATPGMVVPLDRLQAFTGQEDALTLIALSNRGGVRDGLALTDEVVAELEPALAGQGLGVDPIKETLVEQSEEFAQVFTGLFLVLGLFSIAAGILLIVLIFTMLAAERRPEMGMARAVGTRRAQLIQQFVAEGSGYAILAGLAGSALGVLATLGIAAAIGPLFGEFLDIEARITPRSLIVCYCLGVVITFLAVVGSSWKISRLNIVAAVRDIPDATNPTRNRRTLVWAALLLLAGGGLTLRGMDSGTAFTFTSGMSMIPFGVALILRFFGVPSRPVFTLVGLYLLFFWLLPDDTFTDIFGEYDGDIEMFFVSGIFMVIAATIVIVNNLDLLLAALARVGGLFRGKLPAVRTAISYPRATPGRTGMTIAMFSLIVFSLVMIATMNQNFVNLFLGDEANAGWDVRAESFNINPIADFRGALAEKGVETDGFTALWTVTTGIDAPPLRLAGTDEWKVWQVQGMDEGFIAESEWLFQARAEGYDSDAAVVEALRTRPDVAVIDSFAIPQDDAFGGGGEDQFELTGVTSETDTFAPIAVELQNPATGQPHPLTIIGVIDAKIGTLFGLYAPRAATDAVYGDPIRTSYYVKVADPERATETARAIEAALLTNGVQAVSIRDELEEGQRQSSSFLYIIQGFMGLGLLVGIAAVGVIAFRSVVERRQQIGMLRALGYQRGLVALSFLIETAFVVLLGVLSGTILGVLLARNLFTSDEIGATDPEFVVPWAIIATILALTVIAALLMTWVPARQASKLAPAEALRYE